MGLSESVAALAVRAGARWKELSQAGQVPAFGFSAVKVQSIFDNAVPVGSYDEIVNDTTRAKAYRVIAPDICGNWVEDPSNTTAASNGGTWLIRAADGMRIRRLYSGRVSLRWFGAHPLLTDNSDAVLRWSACLRESKQGGLVDAGLYHCLETVDLSQLDIVGLGRPESTDFASYGDSASAIVGHGNPAFKLSPFPYTQIRNLSLVGSGSLAAPIDLWDVTNFPGQVGLLAGALDRPDPDHGSGNLFLENVGFLGFSGWAIYGNWLWGTSVFNKVFFRDCGLGAAPGTIDKFGVMAFCGECADIDVSGAHVIGSRGTWVKLGARKADTDGLGRAYKRPAHIRFHKLFFDGSAVTPNSLPIRVWDGKGIKFAESQLNWADTKIGQETQITETGIGVQFTNITSFVDSTLEIKSPGVQIHGWDVEDAATLTVKYWSGGPMINAPGLGTRVTLEPQTDKSQVQNASAETAVKPAVYCSAYGVDTVNLVSDFSSGAWVSSGSHSSGSADYRTPYGGGEDYIAVGDLVAGEIYTLAWYVKQTASGFDSDFRYFVRDSAGAAIIENLFGPGTDRTPTFHHARLLQVKAPSDGVLRIGFRNLSGNAQQFFRPVMYRGVAGALFAHGRRITAENDGARAL